MKIAITILVAAAVAGALIYYVYRRSAANETPKFSDQQYSQYSEAKEKALEGILGPMHNMVATQ